MHYTHRWTRLYDSAQEVRQQEEVLLSLTRRSFSYTSQNSHWKSLNFGEFKPYQSRKVKEKDSKIRKRALDNKTEAQNSREEEEEAGFKGRTNHSIKVAKCNSL